MKDLFFRCVVNNGLPNLGRAVVYVVTALLHEFLQIAIAELISDLLLEAL